MMKLLMRISSQLLPREDERWIERLLQWTVDEVNAFIGFASDSMEWFIR